MDKTALIEQLAERRFGTGFGSFAYTELTEHGKEQYRALVRQDWPLIVAFVGEWLDEKEATIYEDGCTEDAVQVWREEMGQ